MIDLLIVDKEIEDNVRKDLKEDCVEILFIFFLHNINQRNAYFLY